MITAALLSAVNINNQLIFIARSLKFVVSTQNGKKTNKTLILQVEVAHIAVFGFQ